MAISLMPLPYAEDALAPHISAETLATHHGKHHKAYVDKVNDAIAGTALDRKDLEAIVRSAKGEGDHSLFNNAAQAWNHGFYWQSLRPDRSVPDSALADAIQRDFGSIAGLEDALIKAASDHFGSGWAWLVTSKGKLDVVTTHDAETMLTDANTIPLLTIDVWEHAYYLDVKNDRPRHVAAVVNSCMDWGFASANHARGTVWTYPARDLASQD